MRAAVFEGVGQPLSIEDVPDPELLPRFALVRVGACGICGTDLSITSGRGFLQMPAGWILGHEYAGEVVAVGSDVERLRVGDHVTALAIPACGHCPRCLEGDPQWCTGEEKLMGSGAYAEYAAIAEVQAVKVPGGLSWPDGAIIEPAAVGLHGVRLAGLAPDDRVLVIGAGPIGLAAVFWARRMGAGRVAVMASTARRGPFADAAGATSFLVAGDDPVAEAIDALGGAPDVVIEAAGAPGTIEQAMQTVKPSGTVVVLGWCTVPDSYVPALYLMKEIRLQFSMTYDVAEFRHVIDALEHDAAPLRSLVSSMVSLDELPEVFESLRGGSAECKVIIDPRAQ
jgi:threonine dehydrogenase-like Zn-dependent dehydrogenase